MADNVSALKGLQAKKSYGRFSGGGDPNRRYSTSKPQGRRNNWGITTTNRKSVFGRLDTAPRNTSTSTSKTSSRRRITASDRSFLIHRTTTTRGPDPASRPDSPFPFTLGGNHIRPMGPRGCRWLQIGTGTRTNASFHSRFQSGSKHGCNHLGRGESTMLQGGSAEGVAGDKWFLFQDLCCSQERGQVPTSYQPQAPEPLPDVSSLQDGRDPAGKGPTAAGGLVNQDRPQGRILCSSNTQQPPQVPEVLVEKGRIRVQMPTIWAVDSTKSVHKVDEASCEFPASKGGTLRDISRRYSSPRNSYRSTQQ